MPPIDLLHRVSIEQLWFPFADRILTLITACRARGTDYYAVSGYRTDAEQMALWTQGRTKPGPIVTDAKAGESAHNYGIAVDFCRDGFIERKGLQPDYHNESYDILGEEASKLGLVWGGNWKKKDRPHVQWPGYLTAKDLEPLKAIKAVHGLSAVFDYLDEQEAD